MPDTRSVVKIVLIVVAAALTLALLWLLRGPISWVLLAVFVATALSMPVNYLARHMKRGVAILAVFLGLVLVPVGLIAVAAPPVVKGLTQLADKAPEYAQQTSDYVQRNPKLQDLEEKYQVSAKLEQEAQKIPSSLDDTAAILADIGGTLAGSVAALATILTMSIFMLAGGSRWVDWAVRQQPAARAKRIRKVLENSTQAIGHYLVGAISIATLAGVLTFIVLTILDVPFAAPLAVMAGLFSLLPMIGATLAAVIIGIVTLFVDFPTVTIIWAIWSIAYQQLENTVIQPQIQRRSVHLHPLLVIIAVLCGSVLLGVLGAILAVPLAAALQIIVREWWDYRQTSPRPARARS